MCHENPALTQDQLRTGCWRGLAALSVRGGRSISAESRGCPTTAQGESTTFHPCTYCIYHFCYFSLCNKSLAQYRYKDWPSIHVTTHNLVVSESWGSLWGSYFWCLAKCHACLFSANSGDSQNLSSGKTIVQLLTLWSQPLKATSMFVSLFHSKKAVGCIYVLSCLTNQECYWMDWRVVWLNTDIKQMKSSVAFSKRSIAGTEMKECN